MPSTVGLKFWSGPWHERSQLAGAARNSPSTRYYCDRHEMQGDPMSDNPVTVTKRGRPAKGDQPMTAAERKRAQRIRDNRAAIDAIGDEQNAPLRALLAILGRVEASESARLSAQRAWAEIGCRYGFVSVTEQQSTEKDRRGTENERNDEGRKPAPRLETWPVGQPERLATGKQKSRHLGCLGRDGGRRRCNHQKGGGTGEGR